MITAVPALASAQAAGAEFGVKVGFNVSSIKFDFDEADITSDGRAGIVVGFWGAKDFNPRVGIQVDAMLEQKGGETQIDDDIFDDDASFKLTYLTFPVMARFNFTAGTSTIRFLTGPSFNFHVNESIEVGGVELDGDEVDLETFEMGWVIGGQGTIKNFVIDVRYIWGLTNINSSDDEGEPTVKNNTFQMTFGWRFR
jgi:hypothetical protein